MITCTTRFWTSAPTLTESILSISMTWILPSVWMQSLSFVQHQSHFVLTVELASMETRRFLSKPVCPAFWRPVMIIQLQEGTLAEIKPSIKYLSDYYYYWKGMKNDVQEYVKACLKCFVSNPKVSKEAPSLNPIPVPAKTWSLVGIDIIGPLQETTSGNKYIVAITDHFSKWSEAAAIPDKSVRSVAQFLYSVVCRLGCMDSLISDQGREFVTKLLTILWTVSRQITV